MKFITFNLWHGMAPAEKIFFLSLEPGYRREKRLQVGHEELATVGADILLLQEANPVQSTALALAQKLKCQAFWQGDSVGFKFKNWGWPHNLHSGLATLVRHDWPARQIAAVKLSGPNFSKIFNFISWQWSESRYALFCEFQHPKWGDVLVVNAHLHHGLELTEELNQKIQALVTNDVIANSVAHELRERLAVANHRRETEVLELLDHVEKYKNYYEIVLLGGDLNCTVHSKAYGLLSQAGFVDLWRQAHRIEKEGATLDVEKNVANQVFNQHFPLSVEFGDLTFSPKARRMILDLLKAHEQRVRRIDYLFVNARQRQWKLNEINLFGLPKGDLMAPSDHFGVVANMELL